MGIELSADCKINRIGIKFIYEKSLEIASDIVEVVFKFERNTGVDILKKYCHL